MTDVLLAPLSITVDATMHGTVDGANVILTGISGWHDGPPTRGSETPRLWAHGSFSERVWRDSRLITIAGHAWAASRSDAAVLVDTLASSLAEGTEGTFTFTDPDHGTRWAGVTLSGAPNIRWSGNLDIPFQIAMLAADSRKYGQALAASTGVPVDGGGLGYDLYTVGSTGVLDYGEAGAPGTAALTNVGTADTAPVHTVTGDCPDGFSITELGTGQRMVYAAAVIPGQVIRLDAADGSVTLDDDGDRSAQLVRREWVRLDKGQTGTWLFEAPNSVGALLEVKVVPAWW